MKQFLFVLMLVGLLFSGIQRKAEAKSYFTPYTIFGTTVKGNVLSLRMHWSAVSSKECPGLLFLMPNYPGVKIKWMQKPTEMKKESFSVSFSVSKINGLVMVLKKYQISYPLIGDYSFCDDLKLNIKFKRKDHLKDFLRGFDFFVTSIVKLANGKLSSVQRKKLDGSDPFRKKTGQQSVARFGFVFSKYWQRWRLEKCLRLKKLKTKHWPKNGELTRKKCELAINRSIYVVKGPRRKKQSSWRAVRSPSSREKRAQARK